MSGAEYHWSSPNESHRASARQRWVGSRCAARCGQTAATRIEHLTELRRRRIHRSRTNTEVTTSVSCWSSPVVMMKSPTARANYRLNRGGSKAKFHLGQQTNKLLAEVVLPEQLVTLHPRTSKRTQPRKCRLTYLVRAAPLLAMFACGPGSSFTRFPAASETRRLLRSVDAEKELLIRD